MRLLDKSRSNLGECIICYTIYSPPTGSINGRQQGLEIFDNKDI